MINSLISLNLINNTSRVTQLNTEKETLKRFVYSVTTAPYVPSHIKIMYDRGCDSQLLTGFLWRLMIVKKAGTLEKRLQLISILSRQTQRLLCFSNKSETIQDDLYIWSIKATLRTGTKMQYFHKSTKIDTPILAECQRLIGCSCL